MSELRHQAVLSHQGNLTSFQHGSHTIRFRTSSKLEKYLEVKEWDHGYLVVTAKYQGFPTAEEEYIDLVPILNNLYFDANQFLSTINEVKIAYDR